MRCIRNGILMNRKATGFVTLPRRIVSVISLSYLQIIRLLKVHRMAVVNLTIEARILEIRPYKQSPNFFSWKIDVLYKSRTHDL